MDFALRSWLLRLAVRRPRSGGAASRQQPSSAGFCCHTGAPSAACLKERQRSSSRGSSHFLERHPDQAPVLGRRGRGGHFRHWPCMGHDADMLCCFGCRCIFIACLMQLHMLLHTAARSKQCTPTRSLPSHKRVEPPQHVIPTYGPRVKVRPEHLPLLVRLRGRRHGQQQTRFAWGRHRRGRLIRAPVG